MFNPAFHVKRVKGFVPLFWEKAQVLLRELGKEVQELEKKEGGEGVVVNMEHWVSRTTLDIIGKAGFNYDFNTLQKERSTISDAYKVVFDPPSNLTTRYLNGILIFFPRLFLIVENLPLPELREIKRCYLILWNLAKDLIREGRSSVDAETGEEKRDILSVVRGMGESKEEELRDQVLTFLAAGYDFCLFSEDMLIISTDMTPPPPPSSGPSTSSSATPKCKPASATKSTSISPPPPPPSPSTPSPA